MIRFRVPVAIVGRPRPGHLGRLQLGRPTVIAADTNAYLDALITRSGFWKGYSFRPKPGYGPDSPYLTNQLEYKRDGGYQVSSSAPRFVTYDSTMDAAKVAIPAWVQPAWSMVLGSGMGASEASSYPSRWSSGSSVTSASRSRSTARSWW